MAPPALRIDTVPVEREENPESVQALARIMSEAYAAGLTMIPVGGGSKLHLGNPPTSARLALGTRRLRGIVEYEPDNLTLTAHAGTTLQELQEALNGENQFLPLDPPHPDQATIGGIVACNTSGPIRYRFGTVRDMLIGIKIVHADGTQTKAGGKLVKNVTGYDMCKLYTGSLGTLGIISELTFKVQPKGEAVASIVLAYPSMRALLEATQTFIREDLMPDAMEAFNSGAFESVAGDSHSMPWILALRFAEADEAVRWQVDRLRTIALSGEGKVSNVLDTRESMEFWRHAASARENSPTAGMVLVKCSVLFQSAVETARRMAELGDRLNARTQLFCHAGNFVFYGRYEWPDSSCEVADLRHEISDLRRHCVAAGGHVVLERAPLAVKEGFDVWGYQAPAVELMRRIKNQFDPKGLLNPGRFVGGI